MGPLRVFQRIHCLCLGYILPMLLVWNRFTEVSKWSFSESFKSCSVLHDKFSWCFQYQSEQKAFHGPILVILTAGASLDSCDWTSVTDNWKAFKVFLGELVANNLDLPHVGVEVRTKTCKTQVFPLSLRTLIIDEVCIVPCTGDKKRN